MLLHFLFAFYEKILTIRTLFDDRIGSVHCTASTIISGKGEVYFWCEITLDGFGYIFSRFIDNVERTKIFFSFFSSNGLRYS